MIPPMQCTPNTSSESSKPNLNLSEQAQKQARPYADALAEMLRDLLAAVNSVDHPFMKPGKDGAPIGVILMTADKGLAGAFN